MKQHATIPISEYRKLSDEEVIYRYAKRNEAQAMTCLYERYAHLVLGVCLKYLKETETAKDATQQIFIKLLDDLKRFEINNFKPWLLKVVRNYCLVELRQSILVKGNHTSLPEDLEFEDPLETLGEAEVWEDRIRTALTGLNEAQSTCVSMFYLKRMTYKVVASLTGYSLAQVKSHIQNGRRNIKQQLTAQHTISEKK
ncbi:MAG: sigma-70 family RNA polymerase sigma factor [Bacteroidetes bacterium]|nr:sigma-70 family RNA polymerase sigma factor [Bacteroidota bacterium]